MTYKVAEFFKVSKLESSMKGEIVTNLCPPVKVCKDCEFCLKNVQCPILTIKMCFFTLFENGHYKCMILKNSGGARPPRPPSYAGAAYFYLL